jgi:hypothetical protein
MAFLYLGSFPLASKRKKTRRQKPEKKIIVECRSIPGGVPHHFQFSLFAAAPGPSDEPESKGPKRGRPRGSRNRPGLTKFYKTIRESPRLAMLREKQEEIDRRRSTMAEYFTVPPDKTPARDSEEPMEAQTEPQKIDRPLVKTEDMSEGREVTVTVPVGVQSHIIDLGVYLQFQSQSQVENAAEEPSSYPVS